MAPGAIRIGVAVVSIDADVTALSHRRWRSPAITPRETSTFPYPELNISVLGFAGRSAASSRGWRGFVRDELGSRAAPIGVAGQRFPDVLTNEAGSRHHRHHRPPQRQGQRQRHDQPLSRGYGAAAISGIAGLGAAVVSDTVNGNSQAIIGQYAQIGTAGVSVAGGVGAVATRTLVAAECRLPDEHRDRRRHHRRCGRCDAARCQRRGERPHRRGGLCGRRRRPHATGKVTADKLDIIGGAIGGWPSAS